MTVARSFPLVLTPEFWEYALTMLSSTAGTVPAPLLGCTLALSSNPLDFSSADALGSSIAVPGNGFPQYRTNKNFGPFLIRPDGSLGTALDSLLWRYGFGGSPTPATIAGVALMVPGGPVWAGGCNFAPGVPIVNIGDGFTMLMELVVNSLTTQGSVTLVGPSGIVPSGAGAPPPAIGTRQTQVYATAGTFTWVAPPGVRNVRVRAWGGGSGALDGSVSHGSAAGSGGAYAEGMAGISGPISPGGSYSVVVGAAGARAGSIGSVGSGGTSQFEAGFDVKAVGGTKSSDGLLAAVGGQASSCNGYAVHSGGNGGAGSSGAAGGASGGSSAGPGGAGVAGVNASGATGQTGAVAPDGGGNGGDGGASGLNGTSGHAPGGGAGGAGQSPGQGGAGGAGQVILDWIQA